MNTRKQYIAYSIVFILSILGIGIWLFEMIEIKDWYSLQWVREQLVSPYIVSLLVVFSYLIPFILNKQNSTKYLIIATVSLYAINMICFEAGKQLCYFEYSMLRISREIDIIILSVIVSFLFVILGTSYWSVTNKLLIKNKKANIVFITLVSIASIPLSFATIYIYTGFGTQTGWVDAVKMGYPVFWITLMMGISGLVITKQQTLNQVN